MIRILVALAALTALLVPTTAAQANTYDVYSCWAGYGTFHNPNASSVAWVRDLAAAGGRFGANDDCGVNTTDGAMTLLSLSGYSAANGQLAQFRFTAPTGSTVDQVEMWRNAWSYGTGTGAGSQRNFLQVLADGSAAPGGTDADGTSDVAFGTRGTPDTTSHGIVAANLMTLNTSSQAPSSLSYRIGCGYSAGCPTSSPSGPAPNYFATGVEIFGTQVTIQDSKSPTVVVSDNGLFSDITASGIRPVLVTDAHDESGISRLAVYADFNSTPIGELDYHQDVNWCNWTVPAPCQDVSDVEIPIDTRLLSDGDHSFVVKAFDAAGNEKASSTHYATVKNAASSPTSPSTPTSPTDPSSDTGLPNGIDQNTSGGGPSLSNPPKLAVAFSQNSRSTLRARYARMVTVRGRLTDGSGGPIGDAQIAYTARSSRAGSRVQDLGSVRTDSSGTFTLSVATKLGSRQLRFAYSPQLGGPVASTAEAQLDVVAPVRLKINRKHVRNKQSVRFGGRLIGGPIPRKGKLVNLQVVVDGRWHTFAVVRTTKSGRFAYAYRFKRTYGRVTYRFRALSRYEAAYPFVAGHSRTVRLRVN